MEFAIKFSAELRQRPSEFTAKFALKSPLPRSGPLSAAEAVRESRFSPA